MACPGCSGTNSSPTGSLKPAATGMKRTRGAAAARASPSANDDNTIGPASCGRIKTHAARLKTITTANEAQPQTPSRMACFTPACASNVNRTRTAVHGHAAGPSLVRRWLRPHHERHVTHVDAPRCPLKPGLAAIAPGLDQRREGGRVRAQHLELRALGGGHIGRDPQLE